MKFEKHDSGKPRYSYLPVEALAEVARVMEYGAQKYSKDNWKQCPEPNQYYDAALRHMVSWMLEEVKDPETGYNHLSHAIASLMILYCLTK